MMNGTSSKAHIRGSPGGSLANCIGKRTSGIISSGNTSDLCSYTHRICLQNKLDGFSYCIRHILVDKSSPFRQCSFVHPQSGKRCPNAARKTDRRDSTLCPWHIKKMYLKRKCIQKQKQKPEEESKKSRIANLASLLKELEPYCPNNSHDKQRYKVEWMKQEDDSTTASDYLRNRISESVVARHESESDEDANNPLIDDTLRSDMIESESDSMDSEQDEPLKHAGVYTAEEVSLILRDKMLRLQNLYIGEFKYLQYLLKEMRRKYINNLKQESDVLGVPHNSVKLRTKLTDDYGKLKALMGYHRYHGKEALLKKKAKEKRMSACDRNGHHPSSSIKETCIYNKDGICYHPSLPLSNYCKKHILYDVHQVLFRPCATGTPPCLNPIISYTKKNTCIFHKNFKANDEEIKDILNNEEECSGGRGIDANPEPELFQNIDDIASLALDDLAPGTLFGLEQLQP